MPSFALHNATVIEIDVQGIDNLLNNNHTWTNASSEVLDDPWYLTVRYFQTAVIPVVCIAGFLGNLLAAGVFLSNALRNTSCCLLLAAKSLSDVGFLLSLFIVWLNRLGVPAFTTEGICQTTVFMTYISAFLSVWFVVMITFENFVRVSLSSRVTTWCSVVRAKFTIVIVISLSFAIYCFSLWTTGTKTVDGVRKCLAFEEYETLVMAMTYMDSIITLAFPLVAMVTLNVGIAIGAIKAHKRRKRLFQNISRASSRKKKDVTSPEAKVSKLLFAVSVIFLILHTPGHVIRIKMMLLKTLHGSAPSVNDVILHRVFELMYYLNFSIHCLVYLVFGDNFRAVFVALYCPSCHTDQQNNTFTTYSKRGSEAEAILE